MAKTRLRNGVLVVPGVAQITDKAVDSAVFSVRCAYHGDGGGFLYPSARRHRPNSRCAYCTRIDSSRRPAERYLAQRVISYRHEHGDPTVMPIVEFALKQGIACTYRHGNGRMCSAPMKTRTAAGPRCARHAGQRR